MARSLETDSLSNQNISTALEIGAYTAAATRFLFIRVLADQVAGNDDYTVYATLQVNGAGSAYRLIPITEAAAASGITAIGMVSIAIPVDSGDIVKVYLLGVAGDTTTPDTRVDFYENNYLAPTTADRTLDVTAGGEAGVDWANVGSPTTTQTLSGTTVKTATDVETDTADIQARLPAALTGGGNIKADMQAAANGVITAAVIATDAIDADALADNAITAATFAAGAITAAAIATDAIDNDALAANAVTEIQSGLSTLDAAGIRTAVGLASANLDTQLTAIDDLLDTEVAAIKSDTAAILADTGTDGVVVASGSKTGYALAATGLDSITATRPAGVASTFPQMVVQLFYRFFGKTTLTATQLKTYAANGTDVVTTQTVSDDATTQTQGEAS